MVKIFYKLLLTLLLMGGMAVSAQVDSVFWFAVPQLCDHAHTPITLVVTTFGEQAHIKVTKPAAGNVTLAEFDVGPDASGTQVLVQNDAGLTGMQCPHNETCNNGLYIKSSVRVNAYVAVQQNNSEIYALKGKNGMGTHFFVTMQHQFDNGSGDSGSGYQQARNSVEIIATENGTTVTITPSHACGTSSNPHPAGQSFTVSLNKGQVYTLTCNSKVGANHLGGTVITSDKPIVVDVSDDSVTPHCSATTDNGGGSADLVADQLVPVDLAGGQYIVVPSPSALNNNAPASGGSGNHYLDYVTIFALENNTSIRICSGSNADLVIEDHEINVGQPYIYHFLNDNPISIYATNTVTENEAPIFVFQVTGAGKEFGGTQLPTVNCTGSSIVGYRPLKSANDHNKALYLTLLCKTSDINGFQINGNSNIISPSSFQEIPGMFEHSYCRINVTNNFAPSYNNMIPFRVTNSMGKFHMGVFDVNGNISNNQYDDCSISYFSNYASESEISWDTLITKFNYCQGDTIFFGFDTVDVNITRVYGNGFQIEGPNWYLLNAQPDSSGFFTVVASDSRDGCSSQTMHDSIEITIHPSVEEVIYDTICPGTAYTDNGFDISADSTVNVGILRDSLTLQTVEYGCDSLLILELTIRDSVKEKVVYDTVCPGAQYSGFNGHFEYSSDSTRIPRTIIDTAHLTPLEAGACDSLLILHLLVRDSVFGSFSHTACRSYTYNGRTYTRDTVVHNIVLQGASSHGCDSIVTMDLSILEPSVEIVPSGDLCEDGELRLDAVSDYNEYIWNTGEMLPSITVTQPSIYSVTVTEGNCQAEDQYKVDACEFEIYMPSSITPTSSPGLNDYFYLPEYVHRFISEFEIEIFNRWGELIYSSNDMNFRWYGNYDGKGAGTSVRVSDIYVWVIRVKNMEGKPFTYKGTVTVL